MWETIALILLILGCVLAVLITALRLPGTWLILLAALGYGWWTGWHGAGLGVLVALAILAVIGEIVEFLMSGITARWAGGSPQAAWGGLAGGLLGMVFLSSLVSIPFPVIGTLVGAMIGALIGCFAGAAIIELYVRREFAQGTRVGISSALGFALGTATKLAIAMAMAGILITSAVCTPGPGANTNEPPSPAASDLAHEPADTGR